MGSVRVTKKKQMDEAKLLGILAHARSVSSIGEQSDAVSDQRVKALEYYHGMARGDERKGRSKVISRDVLDTVETLLPELVEVFVGGDDAVEFEPINEDDAEMAEQATEYCNYVFMRDNNGFDIIYTALKDALREKNGIGKVTWEVTKKKRKETKEGLTSDDLMLLGEEDDIEIESQRAYHMVIDEAGNVIQEEVGKDYKGSDVLYDLELCKYYDEGRTVVYNIPPEEFFISPRSVGLEPRPDYCGHETEVTASELIEEYPQFRAEIGNIGGYSNLGDSREKTVRHNDTTYNRKEELDASTRKIAKTEWYLHIDYDGDGVAEYRRMVTCGESVSLLLENEEIDDHPFFDISLIKEPHRFHGTSVAELVMDIQDVNTVGLRQYLDNMYATNNQRTIAVQGMVDMDSLLDSRPNSTILVKSAGAVTPYPVTSIGSESLALMNKMDEIREARTGAHRNSRGLDVDRLHDTAQGIEKLMDKQDKRTMLMARVAAEGVCRIMKLILLNVVNYQKDPRSIPLRSNWIEMNPSNWDVNMKAKVKVGLGTGNRQETITRSMEMLKLQRETASILPSMVTPVRAYKAITDFVKATGNKTPESYFLDPESEEYKKEEKQRIENQPKDPKMVEAEMKMQADAASAQAKMKIEEMKIRAQTEADILKAKNDEIIRRYEIDERMRLEREKAMSEIQLAREKMAMQISMNQKLSSNQPGGSLAS